MFMKFVITVASGILLWLLPLAAQDYGTEKLNYPEVINSSMANSRPLDVVQYLIDLELDPVQNDINGHTRIVFEAVAAISGSIELDFIGLTIDSVLFEGIPAYFSRSEGILAISPGSELIAGDTASVTVFYHGQPQRGL